eukprot:gene4924-34695_t
MKSLYRRALFHYEQIYYHRNTGPVLKSPSNQSKPAVFLGSHPCNKQDSHPRIMGGNYSFGPHSMLGPQNSQNSTGQHAQGVMYCKPPPRSYIQQYSEGTVVTGSQHLGGGESETLEDVAIRELFSYSQQQDRAATEGQVLKRMKTAHVPYVPFKPHPALFYFAKTINPHLVVILTLTSFCPCLCTSPYATAVYPGMDVLKATVQVAGTLWKHMSPEQRQPYVSMANIGLLVLKAETALMYSTAPSPAAPKDKTPTAAAVSEGGKPQCPQSQATHSQAQQGDTLSPFPHCNNTTQSNAPKLPSSHPAAIAMINVHAKAVAAARAAEAMPPPPPRMPGILQVPHPQLHKAREAEDWFTQKTPYQSESNLFKQPFFYHAKGSCEPRNVDLPGQQEAYSHSNVDHVDQPGQQKAYSHSNVDHVDRPGQQKAYSHSNVDHVDQPGQQKAYSHSNVDHVDQPGQQKVYSHSNVDHVDQPGQQKAYSHSNVDHVDQSGQQKAYSRSNVDHVDQPEQKPSSYPPILCDAETLDKNYASLVAQINASGPVECGGQHGGHKEPLEADFPSMGNKHDATFASLGNEHDATFASLLENGNLFSKDTNMKTTPSVLDQDAINFADNVMACDMELEEDACELLSNSQDTNRQTTPSLLDQDAITFADNVMASDMEMEEDACGLLSNSQETNRQTTPSVLDQDAINFADHVMACYMEIEKEEDVCGLLFNSQDTSPSTQGATAYADNLFSEPDYQFAGFSPYHVGEGHPQLLFDPVGEAANSFPTYIDWRPARTSFPT